MEHGIRVQHNTGQCVFSLGLKELLRPPPDIIYHTREIKFLSKFILVLIFNL